MININFITENKIGFGFEWESNNLPQVNDHIIFNTSVSKTDVTDLEVKNILETTTFIIESRMWISDDEITIFIKKYGEIK